jgi:hypothetical protein
MGLNGKLIEAKMRTVKCHI